MRSDDLPSGSVSSRRDLFKVTALIAASAAVSSCAQTRLRTVPADRKIRIGAVGCGGKGASDIRAVAHEDVVALCDVDHERASDAFEAFPDARRYFDWRDMLEQEELDAVLISTPDHSHAPAALHAMERGLHVFCQKPLTHSVEEARLMAETAKRQGVATQMGNQGTGMDAFKTAVEVIRSGAIGAVREVHVWTDRPGGWWPQGQTRPEAIDPIPRELRWDLFLGPAPYRPYAEGYHPFSWRGWWDFGTGALGDMACHIMNLPFVALELGYPESVAADASVDMTHESPPTQSVVRFRFPARGDLPECELVWYDGGLKPPPELLPEGVKWAAGGAVLKGDEGTLYSGDDYGRKFILFPLDRFEGYEPPAPWLPRIETPEPLLADEYRFSGTHRGEQTKVHLDWLSAIRDGHETCSGFHRAGPFSEAVLLGNVAIRLGREVRYDPDRLRAIDDPEADLLLRKTYTRGFELPRRFVS